MPSTPTRPEGTLGHAWPALALLACCTAYVLMVAYVPGFTKCSPLVCPTYRAFGLHCPSCGLTRAIACMARLDPWTAVQFHPLVILVGPAVLLFSIDTCLTAAGRRGILAKLPDAAVRTYWLLLLAGFGVVFIVRVASWLAPECNPSGWLLPPQTFHH